MLSHRFGPGWVEPIVSVELAEIVAVAPQEQVQTGVLATPRFRSSLGELRNGKPNARNRVSRRRPDVSVVLDHASADRRAGGPEGRRGGQGRPGRQGRAGPQGKQGVQGVPGLQGRQGPRGVHGGPGPIGPIGPDGPVGPRGDRGFQGLQGRKGDQGPCGNQGQQGSRGSEGRQGPRGTPDADPLSVQPAEGNAKFPCGTSLPGRS